MPVGVAVEHSEELPERAVLAVAETAMQMVEVLLEPLTLAAVGEAAVLPPEQQIRAAQAVPAS